MKDLDHDPVAQVYGHDGRGCTRGYGDDVSKTALIAADPYKRKAQEEVNSRLELQNEVGELRHELAEEKKARMEMQAQVNAFLSKQGAFQEPNMRCSTSRNASQEVHARFPSTPSPYFPPSQQMCELKSLGGKVVAWGRILTDRDGVSEDAYNIVIDGIFDLESGDLAQRKSNPDFKFSV